MVLILHKAFRGFVTFPLAQPSLGSLSCSTQSQHMFSVFKLNRKGDYALERTAQRGGGFTIPGGFYGKTECHGLVNVVMDGS